MAREFTRQLGVTLQIRTPPPGVALTRLLVEGRGDIAAGVFIPYGSPSARVRYSQAYMTTDIQVITRADQPYTPVLLRHSPSEALHANAVLSEAVAHPESVSPLSEPTRIGWAVRAEHSELLTAINDYHAKTKRSGLWRILHNKYLTTTRFLRSDESTVLANRLSQHDALIARYAEQAGFDWRLIAALVFEESRFDHTRMSPSDAYGLMQVTEIAAREVGVDDFLTLHGNLEAGTRYLQFLLQQFPDGQSQDRLALALSGYLLGPGRVRAVQRLALTLGYDPHCWKDSVESVFPLLENAEYYQRINANFIPGGEAVQYVNAILKRYELYTRYIPREFPAAQRAQPRRPLLSDTEPTG